jgi:hypothetical protein
MCVPSSLRVSIFDCFENAVGDLWICKLIFPALFAVDGNKIMRFAWINPKRDIMWQAFASR